VILTKRAYEDPSPSDGKRILIDRLWPRGIRKEEAMLAAWCPELAPSEELRKWFAHDPAKFPRFRARYRMELQRNRDAVAELVLEAENGVVTLVYGARDSVHCDAIVLKELVDEVLR
jgi:uncharacterized protein YeaO (DUF488 family)